MDKLVIGNIRRSVGLKGYFKFKPTNPQETDYLKDLKDKQIFLNNQSFIIEDFKILPNDFQIKFLKIDEPIKSFSNQLIYANRKDCAPLKDGEYYFADLEKCNVQINDELQVPVLAMIDIGGMDMIEIKIENQLFYVPFKFVLKVDLENKIIYIEPEYQILD